MTKIMKQHELDALFNPQSVAIVGASGNEQSILSKPLRFMQQAGFQGPIYPVNPSRSEIAGLTCYPDLASIPTDIDLVLIQVPARLVLEAVSAAAERGARAAIILSAGFAEIGGDGAELQAKLIRLATEKNIRVLGPNSQGLVYAPTGLVATFTAAGDRADPNGQLAYVGQSGAVGGSVLDLAAEVGSSVAAWAATGNQAELEAVEIAEYLAEQGRFRAIMLYMESTPDGVAYRRLLTKAANSGTRLVVLATGNSDAARRAAQSHTGSMLQDDTAFRLLSEQCGAILVDEVPDLVHVASTIPQRPAGDRVGILTTSGASGIIAAGSCENAGLRVETLSEASQKRLAALLPDMASVENPVDVTAQFFNSGSDENLKTVGKVFLESGDIDQLVVCLGMAAGDLALELSDDVASLVASVDQPVHFLWTVGHDRTVEGRRRLREECVIAFDSTDRLAKSAAAAVSTQITPPELPEAIVAKQAELPIAQGRIIEANGGALLEYLGVPVPKGVLVQSRKEALDSARDLQSPFVVKLQSLQITHKTEVGGVQLGVNNEELESVVGRMLAIEPEGCLGVLVQETAPKGRELIVAITRADPSYPPILTVGMGGTGVELYQDVTSSILPVTRNRVVTMLDELRGIPLFKGFRGGAHYDLEAAATVITEIAERALELGDRLVEIEINPLFVHEAGRGVTAVDVLAETRSA